MKSLQLAVALALGCAALGLSAQTNTLTTLSAIHALTNAQASRNIPVEFEATVTYYRGYERTMFVQDGNAAIYVQATTALRLMPGDRVMVRGTTHESFRPYVQSSSIARLGHGELPKPVPARFDQMIRAETDCMLVTVHAVTRSADLASSSKALIHTIFLRMLTDGGYVDATIDSSDESALSDLLDAEVEVTGVASGHFDSKMQQTGVLMHVPSLSGVKILRRAHTDLWNVPVTPMGQILTSYHVRDFTQRVHVQGTVTYYQPGSAAVLQHGSESLWIETQSYSPLRVGELADATGFPDVRDGFLALTHSEIRGSGNLSPTEARRATWRELSLGGNDVKNLVFDLVSIEGTVVMLARAASQDEYVLMADGRLFSAIYRHPNALSHGQLFPLKRAPLGSRIRVTGICLLDDANPFNGEVPFSILMRSSDDITVVARPSWLTVSNLIRLSWVLLVLILGVSAWGWTLKRKVHRQTAVLARSAAAEAERERQNAHLQQQRSRILEDINGSRPLVEVLEAITELVSFQLNGAPCWCEITDGACLGRYQIHGQHGENLRIVREAIPARSGPPLGMLFAGLDPSAPLLENENEAFFVGSRLATLAIENRRLYSDLVHRSEFDLLTDVHNRFSLDKQLDTLIARAREEASVFGLIYVDLDEFKQVNDLYGHRIGDLYLQEVTLRMSRQLRTGDLLARLGGDEFAALIPVTRNRADVEEIAARLEQCFAVPFAVEGFVLHGSASLGIALYPEDGTTKDSLLSVADAAMYVEKHTKRREGNVARAS